jgi:SAM-dependent methyltransferase
MDTLRRTLSGPVVHDAWTETFHGSDAQPFFDSQFDEIAATFRAAPEGEVLDMGCGPGHHTRRLLDRGFTVVGADFSDAALEQAEQQIKGNVRWVQADLTHLPFETGEFTRVLCYGVLMHVPQLELAVAELARVVAPGGVLVISDGNMHSLDDLAIALLRRLRRKPPVSQRTPRGCENWIATPKGPLFIRHSNIPSLGREFEKSGLTLRSRRPGKFSESYVFLPKPLGRLVHRLNRLRLFTRLSFGTLLTLERAASCTES